MMLNIRAASFALAFSVIGVSASIAQSNLVDVMRRHGVDVKAGAFDVAFDAHAAPTIPVNPGSFAAPVAVLASTTGGERVDAILALGWGAEGATTRVRNVDGDAPRIEAVIAGLSAA